MELEEKIINIVRANINYHGEINSKSTLIDQLNIDSFDNLMIINAVEDEFSITIKQDELPHIKSIQDLVDIVTKYKAS